MFWSALASALNNIWLTKPEAQLLVERKTSGSCPSDKSHSRSTENKFITEKPFRGE
jgi:hypothetical protein